MLVIDWKLGVRGSILRRIQRLKTALENAPKPLHEQINLELEELRREAELVSKGR
jgi:hypothetical protein